MMKILAIGGRCHDCSLCMYDPGTGFFQYIKLEREFDDKHMCFDSSKVLEILNDYEFVPDVIGIEWGNRNDRSQILGDMSIIELMFRQELLIEINILTGEFPNADKLWVSHHDAHIASGWIAFGTDFDYGLSIDGHGPSGDTTVIVKDPFGVPSRLYMNKHTHRYKSEGLAGFVSSFGRAFNQVGRKMKLPGQRIDWAGKVMGLQAYGNATPIEHNSRETICKFFIDMMNKFEGDPVPDNQGWLDLVASMHRHWEETIESLISTCIPRDASVVCGGGAFQNTIFNERILKLYPKMKFIPHCYDGGLSFGVLYYMCQRYGIHLPVLKGYPYLQHDEVAEKPSQETIQKVAQMLADGKIVGWHQGRGEIGPRALGNRSILMNPAIPDGKAILNSKVKHREHWRPYAASVLDEHASEWFETDTPSPYMMRAIPVRESKRSIIPAVTHEDGTCRIQTVTRDQNAVFYDLISEFYKLTGIPMLLNTSLNVGGKPISGHPDRSIALLRDSEMDALCVGDDVVLKKGKL